MRVAEHWRLTAAGGHADGGGELPASGTSGDKDLKRMIRCKLTRRYLAPKGTWTHDISTALNFENMREAMAVQQSLLLQDVEIFLMVGNAPSEYDVTLPLGGAGQQSRNSDPPPAAPLRG
jgi:hypothetical protein